MLLQGRARPIVFGSASLQLLQRDFPDEFDFMGPIKRGDLGGLLDQSRGRRGCVLITDGLFGESMAVSPVECMDMLRAGWTVVGASSIGALRAADCGNVGMIGVGDIFFSFRLGYFHTDADVAVVYNAADQSELTVSFAHADFLVRRLGKLHDVAGSQLRVLLAQIRKIPWYERTAKKVAVLISEAFRDPGLVGEIIADCKNPNLNPKSLDALLAGSYLTRFLRKKLA